MGRLQSSLGFYLTQHSCPCTAFQDPAWTDRTFSFQMTESVSVPWAFHSLVFEIAALSQYPSLILRWLSTSSLHPRVFVAVRPWTSFLIVISKDSFGSPHPVASILVAAACSWAHIALILDQELPSFPSSFGLLRAILWSFGWILKYFLSFLWLCSNLFLFW